MADLLQITNAAYKALCQPWPVESCGFASGRGRLSLVQQVKNIGVTGDEFIMGTLSKARAVVTMAARGHNTVAVWHVHSASLRMSGPDIRYAIPNTYQIIICGGMLVIYEVRQGMPVVVPYETSGEDVWIS
jgi:hypothetical protein